MSASYELSQQMPSLTSNSSTNTGSSNSSTSPASTSSGSHNTTVFSSDGTSHYSPIGHHDTMMTIGQACVHEALRHSTQTQEDYDMLFEGGLSQDRPVDFEETDFPAAPGNAIDFSHIVDSQHFNPHCPDLLLDGNAALDDTRSVSSSLDYDADHEVYHELLAAPQSSSEGHAAPLSHSQITTSQDLPDITNDELEAALDALNLDEPVTFPPEANNLERRSVNSNHGLSSTQTDNSNRTLVKEKFCDFATSIIIQLTLSTTPDIVPSSTAETQAEDVQEDSQYRLLQAKIAKRKPKPSRTPVELKLRNRHAPNRGIAFRTIRFPSTVASTRQLSTYALVYPLFRCDLTFLSLSCCPEASGSFD